MRADVLCGDALIAKIGENLTDEEARVIQADGLRLVPGFIDVHTHGAAGVDVNAADKAGLRRIAAFFATQGVTAFNASVLTDTPETTEKCLGAIANVMSDRGMGAQLLGAHLEGPFLAKEYKGAMPEALLREGDEKLLRAYQNRFPGVIRYITVSPEVPGVVDMIGKISQDVTVAIGHSGADYDTSMEAIRRGARCVTHTFNAMRLFHQHQPAIMGAALESDCWCEAICDGRHLHPGTVRMLLKCKGWDRVIAITDSIMAAGLPDGNYKLGVNDVVVRDGDAVLASNGVRAGSTLTLAQALEEHRGLHRSSCAGRDPADDRQPGEGAADGRPKGQHRGRQGRGHGAARRCAERRDDRGARARDLYRLKGMAQFHTRANR